MSAYAATLFFPPFRIFKNSRIKNAGPSRVRDVTRFPSTTTSVSFNLPRRFLHPAPGLVGGDRCSHE